MPKILLVEDDKSLLVLLKHCLETEGYMVVTAETGDAAMNWIKESRFDLVLLDLMLPDMNGAQICASIKESPRTRSIPVIILTGNTSNEARIRTGLEANSDLFLNKPIDPADLRKAVKTIIEAAERKKLLLRRSIKDRLGE
ncbi:MAG: response regulator transcription factor [Elusimicrobia bacterium]|nr:response regulator transcription factor [Elusimicrobiota bacterium]